MRLTKAQLNLLQRLLLRHYYNNEWELLDDLWPAKSATANSLTRHKLLERQTTFTHTIVYEGEKRTEHRETTYAYRLTKAGRDLLSQRAEQRRAKETK